MSFSEFCVGFLVATCSGMTFRLFDIINRQREFVAILIALKNECHFNLSGRGNSKSPFRSYWLEKALNNLNFYEQCNHIAKEGLEVFELAQDANIDQLGCRKHLNRQSLVPSDVQDKMSAISTNIDSVLSDLQKRVSVWGYLLWRFKGLNLLRSYLVNIWLYFK